MTFGPSSLLTLCSTVLILTLNIVSLSSFSIEMTSCSTVKLSHRQNNISPSSSAPPTLFLHGLDSSSHTWRSILTELQTPGVAVDLRGCGHSSLGKIDEFSPDAIVEDIHTFVSKHEYFQGDNTSDVKKKFVLCGHSMGGRVAMSYAAKYAEQIAALIVEDMDIRTRPMSMNIFQRKIPNRNETIAFDRNLNSASVDEVVELFVNEGYPKDSIKKWLAEGRITTKEEEEEVNYYSEVNPAFRLLCYEQFFITNHGEDTWNIIVQNTDFLFPCHIMVAGKDGTVCDNDNISQMQKMMKSKNDLRMIIHRYEDANHSIHNSAQKKFLKDLNQIIRNHSSK